MVNKLLAFLTSSLGDFIFQATKDKPRHLNTVDYCPISFKLPQQQFLLLCSSIELSAASFTLGDYTINAEGRKNMLPLFFLWYRCVLSYLAESCPFNTKSCFPSVATIHLPGPRVVWLLLYTGFVLFKTHLHLNRVSYSWNATGSFPSLLGVIFCGSLSQSSIRSETLFSFTIVLH